MSRAAAPGLVAGVRERGVEPAVRAALSLALLASGCRAPAPSAGIDAAAAIDVGMSSRVPPTAIALAGIKLDQLRASPLYARLPAAATAFLEPFRGAHSVLVASTGVELLTIARGTFPGATQVAPDLALAGSPALIASAIAAATATTAAAAHKPAAILAAVETVARGHPIWVAVRGGIPLPLEGNLANLNNLVTLTEYMTLSARWSDAVGPGVDPRVDLELTARCPSPDAAMQFEQRLRALVSLTTAANARQPAIAEMLRGVQLRRDERTVRATLPATPDALAKLLR